MTHTVLNDTRVINLVMNGGFDVFQRGTTLGYTTAVGTTTGSSTAVSALTNVVTQLRVGMTVNGSTLGGAKTIATITSNTAITVNSSTGITTAITSAPLQFGMPSQSYFADRWFLMSQTTGCACAQTTGDDARMAALITNNAVGVNQGFGIAQIISATDTYGLRGSEVTFQMDFKNSNGLPMNFAILESSATADSVSKSFVNSWTSTSFTPGGFFASSNIIVTAMGTFTPTAANTFTPATVMGAVSSTANNLILFVWTSGSWTSGSSFTATQAALYESAVEQDWYPRLVEQESLICRKYFERLDLPSAGILANGFSLSSTVSNATIHYIDKRVVPTATVVGLPADLTVTDNAGSHAATGVTVTLPTKHAALIAATVASGLTASGGNIIVDSGNTTHFAVELTADL